MSESNNLFPEFPQVSSEEWKNKIINDLRGKSFEELTQLTDEGFDLGPFYTKEDVDPLDIPMERQIVSWQIRQDFLAADFEQTNKKILNALENGVNAIGIRIKQAPGIDQLSLLLKDVNLVQSSWHFFADEKTEEVFEVFRQTLENLKFNSSILEGSFNLDPLCADKTPDYQSLNALLQKINNSFPKFKALTIHSQSYHLLGKTVSEELTDAIKKLNQYWEGLSTNNYQLSTFIHQVQFSVAVSPNYFMEIAKIRALRWLWQDWQKKQGIDQPISAFIQAQKSWQFNDEADPYHNILQHTTEAMSAVLGGCDVLNLRSTDQADQLDNDFFERISRNIQLILKHEAHLDKVMDPLRGSYYVEVLTKKLVDIVLEGADNNSKVN